MIQSGREWVKGARLRVAAARSKLPIPQKYHINQ